MEHLLLGDPEERLAPPLRRGGAGRRESFGLSLLERERRVQVLQHDEMLEFGRLPERVDERLAMLKMDRVPFPDASAKRENVGERAARTRRFLVGHVHPHVSPRPLPGLDPLT